MLLPLKSLDESLDRLMRQEGLEIPPLSPIYFHFALEFDSLKDSQQRNTPWSVLQDGSIVIHSQHPEQCGGNKQSEYRRSTSTASSTNRRRHPVPTYPAKGHC